MLPNPIAPVDYTLSTASKAAIIHLCFGPGKNFPKKPRLVYTSLAALDSLVTGLGHLQMSHSLRTVWGKVHTVYTSLILPIIALWQHKEVVVRVM